MTDRKSATCWLELRRCRLSVRTLLLICTVIMIALTPTAYLGWKGVLSTICLLVAGIFFVCGQRTLSVSVVVLLGLGQFFYPASNPAQDAFFRADCQANLRRLTYAIHDFETEHGHFPPPYTLDEEGNVLHSWRVLLLPYLGELELYNRIDLDRPWNDPVNVPFHTRMPEVFGCPATLYHSRWRVSDNKTSYVVIVGDLTAWSAGRPISFEQIRDGMANTVAIVESNEYPANWMSPASPTMQSFLENKNIHGPHIQGTFCCSLFDGSSIPLAQDNQPERLRRRLRALLTIAGRERFE